MLYCILLTGAKLKPKCIIIPYCLWFKKDFLNIEYSDWLAIIGFLLYNKDI